MEVFKEKQDKIELKIENENFSLEDSNEKKKLICPECSLTPIITLKNSLFTSQCLSNHKYSSETINIFLSSDKSPDDLQCQEHQGQVYISFCKKCQKNICLDCFEHHEKHENDLIFFHKIKPKQNLYNEFKNKYQKMEHYKKVIDDIYNKITNVKKIIEELNKLINKLLLEINIINNKYQKEYLMNKIIFESFDTKKMNYNSILNINSFNNNIDNPIQLIKSFDMSKLYELIADINYIMDFHYIKSPYFGAYINRCINEEFNLNSLFNKFLIGYFEDNLEIPEGTTVVEKNKEEMEIFDESQKIQSNKTIIINLIVKNEKDNKKLIEVKYDINKKELIIFYFYKLETFNMKDPNRKVFKLSSFISQLFTKNFGPVIAIKKNLK